MQLAEYIKASGLEDESFAALVGSCSPHAVKKWRYQERIPRPDQMRRIAEVTAGAVTPNDFVLQPQPEAVS
jgi:hypothetical protein